MFKKLLALSVIIAVGIMLLPFMVFANTVVTFNSSTTWTVPAGVTTVQVMVVAGGGGGGGGNANDGGGGGAGGVTYNASYATTPGGSITVTVGAGGAGANQANGAQGSNSVFGTITTIGGGGGGGNDGAGTDYPCTTGGSGGGADNSQGTGSDTGCAGTASQGFKGGDSNTGTGQFGAGGGGATAAGVTANSTSNGGAGYTTSISGSSVCYAGGGGGDNPNIGPGTATCGGGSAETSAVANKGGGGGGSYGGAFGGASGGNGGSGVVIVSYSASVPAPLAGYWPLDNRDGTTKGSALDRSTNGTNGTLTNTPTIISGKINTALNFNGTNQYINLGNPTALQITGIITLSAWINMAKYPTDTACGTYACDVIIERGYDGTNEAYEMRFQTTSGTPQFEVGSYGGSTQYGTTWNISGFTFNAWHLLTGTYDGTTWHLYFDGVDKSDTAGAMGALSATANVSIGCGYISGSPSRYFPGGIDDVRIYNVALSSAQINQLYRSAVGNSRGGNN